MGKKKFPSFIEADKKGIFPVIAKKRNEFFVLTKTGESDGYRNIKDAQKHLKAFKKPRATKKKTKGLFHW